MRAARARWWLALLVNGALGGDVVATEASLALVVAGSSTSASSAAFCMKHQLGVKAHFNNTWLGNSIVELEEAATSGTRHGTNYLPLSESATTTSPMPGPMVTSSMDHMVLLLPLAVTGALAGAQWWRHKTRQAAAQRKANAAVKIQCRRRQAAATRTIKQKTSAIVTIQSCCRRFLAIAALKRDKARHWLLHCLRAIELQRLWRGCRVRVKLAPIRLMSVDPSVFACRLSLHLVDGSLHDIELCRRGANPELSRNTREDLAASTRRCGIARLLKRFPKKMGTGSAARRQHARKLAVEARWTAMERDKDNMRTPGSISGAIHGVTYFVPDSLGGACKGRALEQRRLGACGLLPPAGLFGVKSAAIICDFVASAMGVPGSADEDDDGDDEVHDNYPTYDSGDESDDVYPEYGLDVEPYLGGHVATSARM